MPYKISLLESLLEPAPPIVDRYYDTLEEIDDLKKNYWEYMNTEPIDVESELARLPEADYDLCAALLTMLLREDHFSNGAFEERFNNNEVQPIIIRMIQLLEGK